MKTTAEERDQILVSRLSRQLRPAGDQTVYLNARQGSNPLAAMPPSTPCPTGDLIPDVTSEFFPVEDFAEPEQKDHRSLAFSITAETTKPGEPTAHIPVQIRVQATKCFRGDAWSLTLRDADQINPADVGFTESAPQGGSNPIISIEDWMNQAGSALKGYAPGYDHVRGKQADEISLASFGEVGDAILELIGGASLNQSPDLPSQRLKGFLFITGETKSGKSSISRGIIYNYLKRLKIRAQDRNPHFLTFEDPIEKWFYTLTDLYPATDPESAFSRTVRRIDYTPREKSVDCRTLKNCTKDALRQTPTVLLAGEIREPKDLAEAVRFGGTGHLIIATGHAGSLFEAAEQIFSAMDISTSSRRAAHLPKILGVIHLKGMSGTCEVGGTRLEASMTVPTLYRRCPLGLQGLISDGLASLLPNCPVHDEEALNFGSLGRQYLVRKILGLQSKEPKISGSSKASWSESCRTKNREISAWNEQWSNIRCYHAGPISCGDAPPGAPTGWLTDRNLRPLWMKCAEDDVNGIG